MFNKKEFKTAMIMADVSVKDISKALNIDESTVYRRLSADGNFSRGEISVLISLMSLNNDAVQKIFFDDELA